MEQHLTGDKEQEDDVAMVGYLVSKVTVIGILSRLVYICILSSDAKVIRCWELHYLGHFRRNVR